MLLRSIKISLLLLTAVSIIAWKTEFQVDTGGLRPHILNIGMENGATNYFDEENDKVSPPPPPIGPYCFFPVADTAYGFIDALWDDIRAPMPYASWELIIRRIENV